MNQVNGQVITSPTADTQATQPIEQTRSFKVKKLLLVESSVMNMLGVGVAFWMDMKESGKELASFFRDRSTVLLIFGALFLLEIFMMIGVLMSVRCLAKVNILKNLCYTCCFVYLVIGDVSNWGFWCGFIIYPYISLIAIAFDSDLAKINRSQQEMRLDAV